jgi:hypothetical protein
MRKAAISIWRDYDNRFGYATEKIKTVITTFKEKDGLVDGKTLVIVLLWDMLVFMPYT